jgi:uncharacterized protein YebE (UPF0316 family)
MFEFLTEMHPGWVALIIFFLRIVDVSLGTLRTITVVQGRIRISVVLGFLEVLIWITAVSQVIVSVREQPLVILGWAAGFAAGNAVGIWLEKRLALGTLLVEMISAINPDGIAQELRKRGQRLTTFEGRGRDGKVTMIYAILPRKQLAETLEIARRLDPEVFWGVAQVRDWSMNLPGPLPHATGWRSVLKKK